MNELARRRSMVATLRAACSSAMRPRTLVKGRNLEIFA